MKLIYLSLVMHKKDIESMQEHSERIIKNYESDIQNVRDKLCKHLFVFPVLLLY